MRFFASLLIALSLTGCEELLRDYTMDKCKEVCGAGNVDMVTASKCSCTSKTVNSWSRCYGDNKE